MERYHIFKLGLAIIFYAAYCIRPMLVSGLRSVNRTALKPEDYYVFYQVQDGSPGVDFPILSNIPKTAFSCHNIESGYYADLDTDCQVFHICEEGRKISFLCPNGTIFDQSDLICEWWFKVNCTNSPNLYEESAEHLREDLARRKASRKVYLDGRERNHGAVMRVEESSSISTRKGNKQTFSSGTSNTLSSNNKITRQGGQSKGSDSSFRVTNRSGGRSGTEKPKRYNDAETGNYLNKVDEGENLSKRPVEFFRTSPTLDTASSERRVQISPTTPSSLNKILFNQEDDAFQNQLNGNRGNIRFRPNLGSEVQNGSPDYDLQFPKHKSETTNDNAAGSRTATIKIDARKVDSGIQAQLKGRISPGSSKNGIRKLETNESEELQVPQETAAFAKNSYNGLQPSRRKFSTVNPHPNHRTTYSDLKQPSFSTPRFLGSINSVTPQYITTQPLNNGKPFIGSTIGINIYGKKLTSTVAPETSPFGRFISTTSQPVASNTATNLEEYSNAGGQDSRSRFPFSSTSFPLFERTTKRTLDHATVYGSFSKAASTTAAPPSGVEIKFGKNVEKVAIQLSKSVGGETPKSGSPAKSPVQRPDVVHSYSQNSVASTTTKSGYDRDNAFKIKSSSSTAGATESVDNFGTTVIPFKTDVSSSTSSKSSSPNSISGTSNIPGEIQRTTESPYGISTLSPNIPNLTGKETTEGPSYQNTIEANRFQDYRGGSTLKPFAENVKHGTTVTPTQTDINRLNPITPQIDSEGSSGILLKPNGSEFLDIDSGVEGSVGNFNIPAKNDLADKSIPRQNFKQPLGISTPSPKGFERTSYGSSTVSPSTIKSSRDNFVTKPEVGDVPGGVPVYESSAGLGASAGSLITPVASDTVRPLFNNQIISNTAKPFSAADSISGISTEHSQRTQFENKTHQPSVSLANLRGKPFTSSEESKVDQPTIAGQTYKVSTERTQFSSNLLGGQTEQPSFRASVLRGKPFGSSEQTSSTTGSPVDGFRATERIQISNSLSGGKTAAPSLTAATIRGRPFESRKEKVGVTPPTGDGRIYEVFTERVQPSGSIQENGRDISTGNTGTLPGSPFKSTQEATKLNSPPDITVSSTARTIFPSGQPITKITGPQPSVGIYQNSAVSTVPSSERLHEEATTVAPSISGSTPKYGSVVNPPLLKTDAFVHISDLQSTLRPFSSVTAEVDTDTTDTTIIGNKNVNQNIRPVANKNVAHGFVSTTSAPKLEQSTPANKNVAHGFGSTTSAPKLEQSTPANKNVAHGFVSTTSAPKLEQSTSANKNVAHGFVSTTPAPNLEQSTPPHYGSTVSPPLLLKDAFVHISDLQSTPTKTTYVSTAGISKGLLSSTPLPSLKSFIRGGQEEPSEVSTEDAEKQKGTVQSYSGALGSTSISPAVDINIAQNTISSTLAPDVVSFSGNVKLKPAVSFASSNLKKNSSPTIGSYQDKTPVDTGFYVTKNNAYDSSTSSPTSYSSTSNYGQSDAYVNIGSQSNAKVKPLQITLTAPKLETKFEKEVPLSKSESQWPRPFQRPNSLDSKERATYLPTVATEATESTTSTYLSYQISSARPFMLPEGAPAPTIPSPFTLKTPHKSVHENVGNMINILEEIVNGTEQDLSSETPRPGLIVPPSAGPQTLHTLAVYFANALDEIAAEREKLTGEELDEESKEKLTSLLTQMTMDQYKRLFKGKEGDTEIEVTTVSTELEGDDTENLIETPALRQLARNFSVALSSYLDDPESFRRDLENLRPTEPPSFSEDTADASSGDEELLNFSDADTKPSFPSELSTLPSVKPTWGYIIAAKNSDDLDVKNSLAPDLHTSDTQSFVPGFNNLPVDKDGGKGLPENHWTTSPGATKLLQTAFSVNPAVVNDHFVTTEPYLPDTTEGLIAEPSHFPSLNVQQTTEVKYDLKALPKISVNTTEVQGILIDFINTTKDDETNRLQRILKKLNTTEAEFLNRMKEIDSNPLTKRLVLLLISECGTNATRDIIEQVEPNLYKETLESSPSSSTVTRYREDRRNSDIPELVNPGLSEDDQDTRALQLLNSLYTIASKFGK